VAVLKDGQVLVRHAWGFANAERRIPFTPKSLFRMCSITKQFTCATVLDVCGDPDELNPILAARLPSLAAAPGATAMMHNQSGLRDYWAVAMLHGAPAESDFGDEESALVIGGQKSLQFTPRTRFSYCNQNFRLLSDALQERTGRPFADLLRERIFERAGMETAFLAADTRSMPDCAEGYEGAVSTGHRAAVNRILWTGDAGLGASLDDMIAWERHIDATRDDPDSLYARISGPVTFADGATATYGFGLGRGADSGHAMTAHGGALRGWRSHRLYAPAERVSVVVMLNHLSEAHVAAGQLFAAVLGLERPARSALPPAPPYVGAWIDPETGLSARIENAPEGRVRLRFGHGPELLDIQPDGSAGTEGSRLTGEADAVVLARPGDNLRTRLTRLAPAGVKGVAGRYRCAELDAELTVADAGGALHGAFSGFLGRGRMERLEAIGADVWALPCPRALDHTPPGDWTLAFQRDGDAAPARVTVGCWLARGLVYERVG
jgi:D-aminopeptidase